MEATRHRSTVGRYREPSRSVHSDDGRRLRGRAAVARERAPRRLGVRGQVLDDRGHHGAVALRHRRGNGRRRRFLGGDAGGGGGGAGRGPAEPPAEHVRGPTHHHGIGLLDGRRHDGRRDGGVAHVVVEAAAPLAPAEYAAQLAVHPPVPVGEQYGRDDCVRGQREQRDEGAGRRDAGAVRRRPRGRPLGQLEHGVRRPTRGRRDDHQSRYLGRSSLLPVTEHAGVRYSVSVTSENIPLVPYRYFIVKRGFILINF